MEALLVLLGLGLLLVPVLLIVALVQVSGLKSRVSELERRLTQTAPAPSPRPVQVARSPDDETLAERMAREAPPPRPQAAVPDAAAAPPAPVAPVPPTAAAAASPPPLPPTPAPVAPPPRPLPPRRPAAPVEPDVFTLGVRWVRRWFTEGNVPVKVGMLVLLAGVAALLKYASDQGWMRVPMEFRLAGIAIAAMAGLVFGWRQRERKRIFGLSLQGGAIGVLLLVVFAAFKLYAMIPAGAAFAISVVLVAGAGVLAVKQNALALAVFAILAGFLAPIWLSTGSGNHVALFGYYAVLNAGIFAIAWWRAWRILNLLGFVFTWGIGSLWGVLKYRPEHFSTTEPFLLLFFAFYLLIPVLYARRRAAGRKDLIDGCLLFGTPLIAFSLQAGLLEGERMPLAFCALGLGVIYAALAWWLRRDQRFVALATPYALLAVGFATLAVPLALAAEATACVFALEGAALIWLGLRQQRWLPQMTGMGLQVAAALAFVIGASDSVWDSDTPLLNAHFAGSLLISLAGFASAWSYRRSAGERTPAALFYLWGMAWWLAATGSEIADFVADRNSADAVLMLVAFTGWIASEVFRRHDWRALSATSTLAMLSGLPLVFIQIDQHQQPFAALGWLAWALYAVFGGRSLLNLRERAGGELAVAHLGWLWSWALVLGLSLFRLLRMSVDDGVANFGSGWTASALLLPILIMAALTLWRPNLIAQPLAARFGQWRSVAMTLFVAALVAVIALALLTPANPHPLMWLPVLNPLSLLQLATLVVVGAWLASPMIDPAVRARRVPVLAVAGFVLITVEVLRSAHFWGQVPWGPSMFSTGLVQTSLTLVWSVLGVAGWIAGSRRGQRLVWLASAVLMGVVLVKLIAIDRIYLGNLPGIASFIAYGLLCIGVGYFAPAPPSKPDDSAARPDGEDDSREVQA